MEFDTLQRRMIAGRGLTYGQLPAVRWWERWQRIVFFNNGIAQVPQLVYTVPASRLAVIASWWWKARDPAVYVRGIVNLIINDSPIDPLELIPGTDVIRKDWYPVNLTHGLSSNDRVLVEGRSDGDIFDQGTWTGVAYFYVGGWEFDPLQDYAPALPRETSNVRPGF